jgi:hypothetical protein
MPSKIILIVLITFLSTAHADFHRFYRGFSSLEVNIFIEKANKDFFPLFIPAHPLGLTSYRPLLLNEDSKLGLPNEIVILSFKDETTYKEYAETPVGKAIRAAHGPVFASSKSSSLVSMPFTPPATYEKAYSFFGKDEPTRTNFVGVMIFADPILNKAETLDKVSTLFVKSDVIPIISLLAENYLIEYYFGPEKNMVKKLSDERAQKFKQIYRFKKFIPLKKHKIGETPVEFGEGMDAQW